MRYASLVAVGAAALWACSQSSEPVVGEAVELREATPGLLARATITLDAARATALERVSGAIVEAELEEERGVLLYSFEVRQANGAVSEVEIDAGSGAVLSVEEEDEADEGRADDDSDDGEDTDGR